MSMYHQDFLLHVWSKPSFLELELIYWVLPSKQVWPSIYVIAIQIFEDSDRCLFFKLNTPYLAPDEMGILFEKNNMVYQLYNYCQALNRPVVIGFSDSTYKLI